MTKTNMKVSAIVKKQLKKAGFVINETGAYVNEANGFLISINSTDKTFMVSEGTNQANNFSDIKDALEYVEQQTMFVESEEEVNADVVVVEIFGFTIETEIKKSGNRKIDIANALSFIVGSDDMVEGDADFAKELNKWTDGILVDLINIGQDKIEWSAWASATKETLKETLARTSVPTEKPVKENRHLTIHFNYYEVECPVVSSENLKLDLINCFTFMAGAYDIIEGEDEFAEEICTRINSLVREMKYAKLSVPEKIGNKAYSTWEAWGEDMVAKTIKTKVKYQKAQAKSSKKGA